VREDRYFNFEDELRKRCPARLFEKIELEPGATLPAFEDEVF